MSAKSRYKKYVDVVDPLSFLLILDEYNVCIYFREGSSSRPGANVIWSADETGWIGDTFEESVVSVHDDVVLVENDVGGKDEPDVPGYDENPSSNLNQNWLVPSRELDEAKLKSFDPDTVATSVVPSPLYGIRGLLKMGAVVGAFPADMGERSVVSINYDKLDSYQCQAQIALYCIKYIHPAKKS